MNDSNCSTLTIPEILALIDKHQAVQKSHPFGSKEWEQASEKLAPLFKLMADKAEGKS